MNSKKQPIITKSGQTFEFFDTLDEALKALDENAGATALIEFKDNTDCVLDETVLWGRMKWYLEEGGYNKTDIRTVILNSEKNVIQIYGIYHIEDYDSGKKYDPETDNSEKIYVARGHNKRRK